MGKEKDIVERHLLEFPEVHKEALELVTGQKWEFDPVCLRHYPVHVPRDPGMVLTFMEQDSAMMLADSVVKKDVLLSCLENQTRSDPNMVERLMASIANQYLTRAQDGKSPVPIVSGVLHYGDRPWTCPVSLSEKMNTRSKDLPPVFPDFRIRVVDLGALPDEVILHMKTDLRFVAWMVKAKREGRPYTVLEGPVDHPVTTLRGLMYLSGSEISLEETEKIIGGKEKWTMEQVFTCLTKEQVNAAMLLGERKGLKQGRQQGRKKGREETRSKDRQLYSWLKNANRLDDYERALSSEEAFDACYEEMKRETGQ